MPDSLNKGLHRDFTPSNQPEGTYRYALNKQLQTNDELLGELSNEKGTNLCYELPDGYNIVGSIFLQSNKYVLFLTNGNLSIIGLVDNCNYETLLTSNELNFSIQHPIHGVWRTIDSCITKIYFTDNFNTPKAIKIDDLEPYLLPGQAYDRNDPTIWNNNEFQLFRDVQVPVIRHLETRNSGGYQVKTGTYRFAVRYVDEDGNPSGWSNLTNAVPIVDELLYNGIRTDEKIDGTNNNLDREDSGNRNFTSKSILLEISNLDINFPFIQIGVIQDVNSVEDQVQSPQVFALELFDIKEQDTVQYLYNGDDVATSTDLEVLDIVKAITCYKRARKVFNFKNRLLLGNLAERDYDWSVFQRQANNIKTKWVTTPRRDNYLEGSSSASYYQEFPSLMRDEIYALGIVWVFNDGKETEAFHIPGREANTAVTVNGVTFEATNGLFDQTIDNIQHPRVNAPYGSWDTEPIPYTADALPMVDCETSELDYIPTRDGVIAPDISIQTRANAYIARDDDGYEAIHITYDIQEFENFALGFDMQSFYQVFVTENNTQITYEYTRYIKGYKGGDSLKFPNENDGDYTIQVSYNLFSHDGKVQYAIAIVNFDGFVINTPPTARGGTTVSNGTIATPLIIAPDPGNQIERWKVYNTATSDQPLDNNTFDRFQNTGFLNTGQLGYHRSCTRYPDVKDCNGDFIYPTVIENGVEVPDFIRHHRMPDTTLIPHIIHKDEYGGFDDNYIVPLGLDFFNIEPPAEFADEIVGYKIVVGERNFENKTILDKGVLLQNYYNVPYDNLYAIDNLPAFIDQAEIFNANHNIRFSNYSVVAGNPNQLPAELAAYNVTERLNREERVTGQQLSQFDDLLKYKYSKTEFFHSFYSPADQTGYLATLTQDNQHESYIKFERHFNGLVQYEINNNFHRDGQFANGRDIIDHYAYYLPNSTDNGFNNPNVELMNHQIENSHHVQENTYLDGPKVNRMHSLNNLIQNQHHKYITRTPVYFNEVNEDESGDRGSVVPEGNANLDITVNIDSTNVNGTDYLVLDIIEVEGEESGRYRVGIQEINDDGSNGKIFFSDGKFDDGLNDRTELAFFNADDFFDPVLNTNRRYRIYFDYITINNDEGWAYDINQDDPISGSPILTYGNDGPFSFFILPLVYDFYRLNIPVGDRYNVDDIKLSYVAIKHHNQDVYNNLSAINYKHRNNNNFNADERTQRLFCGDSFIGGWAVRKIHYGSYNEENNPNRADDNIKQPWRDKHMFYVYYESDINPSLRSSNLTNNKSDYFYPKHYRELNILDYLNQELHDTNKITFYDFSSDPDNFAPGDIIDFIDDEIYKAIYNKSYFNHNYSFINKGYKSYFAVAELENGCENCENRFPYRWIYSNPSDQQRVNDPWMVFLPINFKDINSRTGELTNFTEVNNQLFLQTEFNTYNVQPNDQRLQTDNFTINIGDGGLFTIDPISTNTNVLGQSGNQNTNGIVDTPNGHVFIDRQESRVYVLTPKGINPISRQGLNDFFNRTLKIQNNFNGPDYIFDDPINPNGFGFVMGYDQEHDRLIIHVKNHEVIEDVQVVYDEENNEWIIDGNGFDLNNEEVFNDISYTISYSFFTQTWVSEHSYRPNHIISLRSQWHSSMFDLGTVHIHDLNKQLYTNYYGIQFPSIVEFVAKKSPLQSLIGQSIQYWSNVLEYDPDLDDYENIHDETYNEIWVYNTYQSTGWLNLSYKDNNPYSSVVKVPGEAYVDRTEREWFVNNLQNAVVNNGVIAIKTYPSTEGNLEPNNNIHDQNLSQYNIEQMREDFMVVRMKYNDNKNIRFKVINPIVKPSIR